MKNQITIREAVMEQDIAVFWQQLLTYFIRDIFPFAVLLDKIVLCV